MRRLVSSALFAGILVWLAVDFSPAASPMKSGRKHNPREFADLIDRLVDRQLAEAKIPASPLADDAEFLRRATLDITGRVPKADRAREFLADTDPDKRRKLIDQLLDESEYGEHFATIWYHRMVQPNMDNQGLLSKNFKNWLAERFNKNDGWDKTVKEILTASGDRDENPATVFWLNNIEGNNRRDVAPNKVAAAASQLFLGVKLECCECHNHPFDPGLKQSDFWGVAAFFSTTKADQASKQSTKSKDTPAIREQTTANRAAPPRGRAKGKAPPRQAAQYGQIVIPDSNGKTVTARFPLTETPRFNPGTSLRTSFADWLTKPNNAYFARASANKLWANFFGRGIVVPMDDIRPTAANSHPELFEALAVEFAASGFDQKHMIRCICNSQAYQRSSKPLSENKDDEALLSHMRLKVMSADMLFDSLAIVLEQPVVQNDRRARPVNPQRGQPPDARDQFRRFFHAEADDDAGVVEEYTHGVPQVLRLMNSAQMNNMTAIVRTLMRNASPEEVIESLYLRVLARKPTSDETSRMLKFIADERDKTKAYSDAMWALLNSAEFMFNH
jgi:hypothetical protein